MVHGIQSSFQKILSFCGLKSARTVIWPIPFMIRYTFGLSWSSKQECQSGDISESRYVLICADIHLHVLLEASLSSFNNVVVFYFGIFSVLHDFLCLGLVI